MDVSRWRGAGRNGGRGNMTAYVPARTETNLTQLVRSLQGLAQGRSNAVGTVTLTPSATTTTVMDPNCAVGTNVQLTALTANAAAAKAAIFFTTANGSFVINHASAATTDRRFTYALQG